MGTKTYDQQSYDLAQSFLSDDPKWLKLNETDANRAVDELAGEIQQTIEDYLSGLADGGS